MRLEFEGKQHIYGHHLTVPYSPLVLDDDKSLPLANGQYDDGNIIVHGDNLRALKALLPTYAGRIKCIYIDPPYNTGNREWAYNDDVNSPLMKQWLAEHSPVDGEDLERHDKWLCMMWPRLHLLRDLLTEDGVIFVSIDENEHHHLRMLMDEIFGERNFVGTIVWKNVTDNNPTRISAQHEYIVCFAASKTNLDRVWKSSELPIKQQLLDVGNDFIKTLSDPSKRQAAYTKWFRDHKAELGPFNRYKYIDDHGIYTGSQSVHNPGREGYRYDVFHPKTGRPCKQPLRGYRFPHATMSGMLRDDRILFGSDENKIIEIKLYAEDYKAKLSSVIELDTRLGSYELKDIFSTTNQTFNYPKPSKLIEELLSFATDRDSIVLDSFAGSGTTAQAVLALNETDGGTRAFILVECEKYADDLTAERVRRIIQGVPRANDKQVRDGYGGSFCYYTLGDPFNVSSLLTGESLPTYEDMAIFMYCTATGKSLKSGSIECSIDKPFHRDSKRDFWLLYRPELEWLRGSESALTQARAERISDSGRTALVFASHKHVTQRRLADLGITFCQIPFVEERVM